MFVILQSYKGYGDYNSPKTQAGPIRNGISNPTPTSIAFHPKNVLAFSLGLCSIEQQQKCNVFSIGIYT